MDRAQLWLSGRGAGSYHFLFPESSVFEERPSFHFAQATLSLLLCFYLLCALICGNIC